MAHFDRPKNGFRFLPMPDLFWFVSLLTVGIGTANLVSWFFHPTYQTFGSVQSLIKPTAALVVTLFGMALSAHKLGLVKFARAASCLSIFIGLVIAGKYLTGYDLYSKDWLIELFAASNTPHVGQVAPATTITFILTGIALWALDPKTKHPDWPAFCSVTSLSIAAFFLMGRILLPNFNLSEKILPQMSLITSGLVVAINGVILSKLSKSQDYSNAHVGRRQAHGVLIFCVSLTSLCWHSLTTSEIASIPLLGSTSGSHIISPWPFAVLFLGICGSLIGAFLVKTIAELSHSSALRLAQEIELSNAITALKAHKALLETEVNERRIVESHRDASLAELNKLKLGLDQHAIVSISDIHGTIIYANQKFCEISQYSRDELLGQNHRVINSGFHPKDYFQNMWQEIMAGRIWQGTLRNKRKDGSFYWVTGTVVPILSNDGKPRQFVSIRTDITKQIQLQERLAEREERLQVAIAGANLGTWDWVRPTNTFTFNERWCEMLGYASNEISADLAGWTNLVHPDDIPRISLALNEHLSGLSDSYRCEYRLRAKDGHWVWVLDAGRVLMRDAKGEPVRLAGIHLDISELKNARINLEQEKAKLEAFVKHSPAAVAMFNPEMQYLTCSNKWLQDYQLQGVNVLGRCHYDLFPATTDRWREVHQRALQGTVEICNEELISLPNGKEIWIKWEVRPWYYASNQIGGIIIFTEDITHEREILDQLRHARVLAESAAQAKATFLANMSHEIRTPLTAILGFSERLSERTVPEEERVESVDAVLRNAQHLLGIVNDILDFSKLEAGKLTLLNERCQLPEIMAFVESTLKPRAISKKLAFEILCDYPIPKYLNVDALRLKQVLINLLGNSIKFTENGWVKLRVSYDRRESLLELLVTDSGIGMTEDQLKGLFQAFSQADNSTTKRFGGTGLGLSITKSLVDLMNGDLSVASTYAKGSSFKVTLRIDPVGDNDLLFAAETRSAAEQAETLQQNLHGSVLLVEDSVDNQRLISRVIKRCGLAIEIADNGSLALRAIKNRKFDLVLMDMQMPIMDGYTAVSRIRQSGALTPIVACTANPSQENVDHCLALGCNEVIFKPFTTDKLIDLLVRFIPQTEEVANSLPRDSALAGTFELEEAQELQRGFLSRLPETTKSILAAADRADLQEVNRLVHKLRGSAALFGFTHLSEIAGALENASSKNEAAEIPRYITELAEHASELRPR